MEDILRQIGVDTYNDTFSQQLPYIDDYIKKISNAQQLLTNYQVQKINEFMNSQFVPKLSLLETELNLLARPKIGKQELNWMQTRWMGFYFKKAEWQQFEIGFEFESLGMKDLITGILFQTGVPNDKKNETYQKIQSINMRGRSSLHWPNYQRWTEYANWNTMKVLPLLEGDYPMMISYMKDKINNYLTIIESNKIQM